MQASQFRETPELQQFDSYWDQHPDYPVEDWQSEVANGDTRLGYWDWLLCQMESEDE